jgi:hypothetical protein
MVVNGYLTTNLLNLCTGDFETEDSYNHIKMKLSTENNLNDYLQLLASNFEMPCCMFNLAKINQIQDKEEGNV